MQRLIDKDGTMEEQMILFANLFRHLKTIREEIKVIDKSVQGLLQGKDWEDLTLTLNEIASEARLVQAASVYMREAVDSFLACGPYEGQGAGRLPLEGLVDEN